MMGARCEALAHSDNGAARRFERPMSSRNPRHRVKGEALAHSYTGAARRFERPMSSRNPRHRVKGEA
ncbi:MAG: hypothetical protein WBH50_23980, partial [Fuerstiella sp.]